jgi:hypothetical protein
MLENGNRNQRHPRKLSPTISRLINQYINLLHPFQNQDSSASYLTQEPMQWLIQRKIDPQPGAASNASIHTPRTSSGSTQPLIR